MRTTPLRLALLSAVLAGCGAAPFQYQPVTEIPDGPGMLTGKKGTFVVYAGRHDEARSDAHSSQAAPDEDELLEFQAFRRWKETNRDSPEYREFLEWKEWKAFRAWKQQSR